MGLDRWTLNNCVKVVVVILAFPIVIGIIFWVKIILFSQLF